MQNILDNFEVVHNSAMAAAKKAGQAWIERNGHYDCCGFSWCTIRDVRSNSKLGKLMKTLGYDKSYSGGLQLWDPSKANTQAMGAKEAGADAYVDVMRAAFPEMKIYTGSRMD